MSDELAVAMVKLSPQEREALLLVAWEGLDSARAARAAGCTPVAFRARLHRARRHVAAALAAPAIANPSSIAGEPS
jgi:RNA polymerase sigma-70 factor (ECF subfamily)